MAFFWPITILFDRHIGHLRRYDEKGLQRKFQMRLIKTIYTGHLVKVWGVFLSKLFRTKMFLQLLEEQDSKLEDVAYGANNILVVLEK